MIKEKHIAARKHQKTFHMEYKLKRLASELYIRSFNNKYSCVVEIKTVFKMLAFPIRTILCQCKTNKIDSLSHVNTDGGHRFYCLWLITPGKLE